MGLKSDIVIRLLLDVRLPIALLIIKRVRITHGPFDTGRIDHHHLI